MELPVTTVGEPRLSGPGRRYGSIRPATHPASAVLGVGLRRGSKTADMLPAGADGAPSAVSIEWALGALP